MDCVIVVFIVLISVLVWLLLDMYLLSIDHSNLESIL
mgnify:CR=1 FL=1